MENLTDSSLMKLIQAGDSTQLGTLFERYHAQLFRYFLHMTRNRPLSEDLVQEVFFRVLKYARSYDPRLSFPAWLYGMARNACIDSFDKSPSRQTEEPFNEIRSAEPMAEELISRKQDLKLLQRALENLPAEKREVLVLSRFQNLRYEQIARILKCETGTVKVRAASSILKAS